MKLYRVTHPNGCSGVDGQGSPDLNFGDEAEMTDEQAKSRIGKIKLVSKGEHLETKAPAEKVEVKETRTASNKETTETKVVQNKSKLKPKSKAKSKPKFKK